MVKQDITGNGGTGYTLSHPVSNENDILLYINNVKQEGGSGKAFTASGTTLTLSEAIANTDSCYVQYIGLAIQTTVPPDGSVSTAKIASSAVDLTSKVTGVLPVANGGTGLSSSEADQFRLTADTTNGANGDITADLERVDDATFAKIGTGMTESSGVFTFPSTGLWQVIANPLFVAVSDNSADVYILASSTSGSSYDNVARASGGGGGSSFDRSSSYSSTFVNVTNASTFRVKFLRDSFGSSSRLVGNTVETATNFMFIRLGGSQ